MAAFAIASFDRITLASLTTTDYEVSVLFVVTNGTTINEQDITVTIPLGTSEKKSNQMVRETIAATILSSYSLTIDPSDIYIPGP
jgi:hypothetical protein